MDIQKAFRTGNSLEQNQAASQFWADSKTWFAISTGYTFTGLSIRKRSDGWMIVIRAQSRDDEPLVTFIAAGSSEDPLTAAAASLVLKLTRWSHDRFAEKD